MLLPRRRRIGRVAVRLLWAEGSVSVELAGALTLIAALFLPMIDLGMGTYAQIQVQDAAQAGAEYASVHGFSASGISGAVTSATGLSTINATPAPSEPASEGYRTKEQAYPDPRPHSPPLAPASSTSLH